ncbi:MAG: ABC transporter ATP-binding protein [Chlamydiota bacterium]
MNSCQELGKCGTEYAIATRELTRRFASGHQATTAVDHVSLQVRRGEFVATMGHSGSGKTTLLYLIAGLAEPTSGEVFIEGAALSSLSESQRAYLRNTRMGFIFQRFNLLSFLSVEANIYTPGLLGSWYGKGDRQRALELLAKVGLAGKKDEAVTGLSAGEQQRVAIARALMNRPKILLADEPTGNLDSYNARAVLDLLLGLREEFGVTILMVTHNPEVALMADRILEIADGRIRREAHTRDIAVREEWLRRFATPLFDQLEP